MPEVLQILSEGYMRSSIFQSIICMRPDFLQSSTKTTYHKKLNAEGVTRKQLSSIKSDIKEICKNVKRHLKNQKCSYFYKKITLLVLAGFIIVILTINNLKFFSVLVSNMVNLDIIHTNKSSSGSSIFKTIEFDLGNE